MVKRLMIVAAGLGTLASGEARAAEASYTCEDGTGLTAVIAGASSAPGTATLTFGDGAVVTLPQALSADGGRYADGSVEFWIKGRGATLTRDGRATNCTTAR